MTPQSAPPAIVSVRQDDLRRLILDAERPPCMCDICMTARRRLRAAAWPKQDGVWPPTQESTHA